MCLDRLANSLALLNDKNNCAYMRSLALLSLEELHECLSNCLPANCNLPSVTHAFPIFEVPMHVQRFQTQNFTVINAAICSGPRHFRTPGSHHPRLICVALGPRPTSGWNVLGFQHWPGRQQLPSERPTRSCWGLQECVTTCHYLQVQKRWMLTT